MCIQISAQTASCMAVVNELDKNNGIWSEQEAIDYILIHADSFDMENELDKWFYNATLGTRYYPLKKYQEALSHLREVTMIFDKYTEESGIESYPQLPVVYYWEAICELHLASPKEIVLQKLNKAKSVYERLALTQTEIYSQILSDIEFVNLDILKDMPQAIDYVLSNKHSKAIPIIENIIEKWPKSLPLEKIIYFYQLLGNCYIAIDRLNDAEQLYLHALSELKQSNNEQHEAYRNISDALGVLYCQVHNYQKGKDFSGQSKWLHEKYLDFDESYIRCLSNCALAEFNLGNIYFAKLLIDVALKYARKGYGYGTSQKPVSALQEIAPLSKNNVNWTKFSNNAEKAFQERFYIQILSNAAAIYQHAGFWDDAVLCLKESIYIGEQLGEQNSLAYNNMGTLYLSQSRIDESLPYFSTAASLCKTDYESIEILFNYALALWLLNSDSSSEVAIQVSRKLTQGIANNFSFLSQEEKTNYYKPYEFYLPFLNLILYEKGKENEYGYIYDNILTTKGLLLRAANNVKSAILQSGDEELISDYNQLISFRHELLTEQDSALRIDIAKKVEHLDKKLSRSASDYGAFTKFNNIKWNDVRESLGESDIAIEFYNIPIITKSLDTVLLSDGGGEPRYCAVILKKDYQTPKVVPLCRESELIDLDNDSLYCSDLLYRLIWEPLQTELKDINQIFFSADRELHKIGVEYALLEDGSRISDHYKIFRLSSTRLLAETRKKEKSYNAVLYGGLQYDLEPEQLIAESRSSIYHPEKKSRAIGFSNLRYGVTYLPGTKTEIEDIYKSFTANKKTQCRIITDIAGTEESFKAFASKDIDIIHLATHGFYWSEEDAVERNYVSFLSNLDTHKQRFEDQALLRSGLFFSGANIGLAGKELPEDVEDGVLTAQELSVMNLGNVDLVVMSACQSGLGEISGEGVFGLQRGFKLAGANTLLMSLWKVDDNATKNLMTEFYKHFLSGKSKREALYLAQQALRKTYPEPEYWASFIILDAIN